MEHNNADEKVERMLLRQLQHMREDDDSSSDNSSFDDGEADWKNRKTKDYGNHYGYNMHHSYERLERIKDRVDKADWIKATKKQPVTQRGVKRTLEAQGDLVKEDEQPRKRKREEDDDERARRLNYYRPVVLHK